MWSVECPSFGEVLSLLPARDVARLRAADGGSRDAVEALRSSVLRGRRSLGCRCDAQGVGTYDWSWQKAHAVESAMFLDEAGRGLVESAWAQGPNTSDGEGNLLELLPDDQGQDWLWISQGADWRPCQGGSARLVAPTVSDEDGDEDEGDGPGIRPEWVTFRVRVDSLAFSGANLALASRGRKGLQKPTLLFGFRGFDSSSGPCFVLEAFSGDNCMASLKCRPSGGVQADLAYEVAIHLDWASGELALFIDGQFQARAFFETCVPLRVAAVYNLRSKARAAFSELMLGRACPWSLRDEWALRRATSWMPCRLPSWVAAQLSGPHLAVLVVGATATALAAISGEL